MPIAFIMYCIGWVHDQPVNLITLSVKMYLLNQFFFCLCNCLINGKLYTVKQEIINIKIVLYHLKLQTLISQVIISTVNSSKYAFVGDAILYKF